MRILSVLAVIACVLLSGCTQDRNYTVEHDRLVVATLEAIVEEANVKFGDIKRHDCEVKGGRQTLLTAPYKGEISKLEATIDSTAENSTCPALKVRITTGEVMPTEHKDWADRIHEVALLKLTAKTHGAESKPTSLPAPKPAEAEKK